MNEHFCKEPFEVLVIGPGTSVDLIQIQFYERTVSIPVGIISPKRVYYCILLFGFLLSVAKINRNCVYENGDILIIEILELSDWRQGK